MELVGEFLNLNTDQNIWQYFRQHWLDWFPNLGSYPNFCKHCANLYWVKQKVQQHISQNWCEQQEHYVDAFPIKVCHLSRAKRHKNFCSYASIGYCASKQEFYFGFKGHIVVTRSGMIKSFTFTPAHVDERQVLPELLADKTGFVGADMGYLSRDLQSKMKQQGIDLQTPFRSNMTETRNLAFLCFLKQSRRIVEIVINQLTDRFAMAKACAKTIFHQSNRFMRKILSHNFCCMINHELQQPITQFELLIQ